MNRIERRKEGGTTVHHDTGCSFGFPLTPTTMTRIESISRSVARTTEFGWLDIPQHAIDALVRSISDRHTVSLEVLEHSTEESCPQVAEIGPHYRLRLTGPREALADAATDVDNAFLDLIRTHGTPTDIPVAR